MALTARLSKDKTRVLCGRQACGGLLLYVERNSYLGLPAPADWTAYLPRTLRPAADGIIRPTPAARAARKRVSRGERPRLRAERPSAPLQAWETVRGRRGRCWPPYHSPRVLANPLLPLRVECPACGFINEVTEAVVRSGS